MVETCRESPRVAPLGIATLTRQHRHVAPWAQRPLRWSLTQSKKISPAEGKRPLSLRDRAEKCESTVMMAVCFEMGP